MDLIHKWTKDGPLAQDIFMLPCGPVLLVVAQTFSRWMNIAESL